MIPAVVVGKLVLPRGILASLGIASGLMALTPLARSPELALYEVEPRTQLPSRILVASTPETREICNDSFCTGVRYTQRLESACAKVLRTLASTEGIRLSEESTTVLNILRGGLNFGLRGALAQAYGWSDHPSMFISAQRARQASNPKEWHITESSYQKLHLPKQGSIVFGDVVATGTSLQFALRELARCAHEQRSVIQQLLFFTIGGPRSHEIVRALHDDRHWQECGLKNSVVIFFEGIFAVAGAQTKQRIQIDGTDLLRAGSLLAPEFVESQYLDPAFPLERCTIYDAGSRAFELPVYLADLRHYWEQVSRLADQGVTFPQLLQERLPELDSKRYGAVTLTSICETQLRKLDERNAPAARDAHE